MVVQVRRGGKPVRVPGAGGMVRQHIRLGFRHDSRAMPELLKRRAWMWLIANNKQRKTWTEFIDSIHTYFLSRDFFTRLADQVRQRKQGFSELFKDYMTDMQTMVRPINNSTKDSLRKNSKRNGKRSRKKANSRRPSRHHQHR